MDLWNFVDSRKFCLQTLPLSINLCYHIFHYIRLLLLLTTHCSIKLPDSKIPKKIQNSKKISKIPKFQKIFKCLSLSPPTISLFTSYEVLIFFFTLDIFPSYVWTSFFFSLAPDRLAKKNFCQPIKNNYFQIACECLLQSILRHFMNCFLRKRPENVLHKRLDLKNVPNCVRGCRKDLRKK